MKQMNRELRQHWRPIFRGQEVPDFGMMQDALKYDDTSFEDDRLLPTPHEAPTGRGHLHDGLHTANYVTQVLHDIHPSLKAAYQGGSLNHRIDNANYAAGPVVNKNVVTDQQFSPPSRKEW